MCVGVRDACVLPVSDWQHAFITHVHLIGQSHQVLIALKHAVAFRPRIRFWYVIRNGAGPMGHKGTKKETPLSKNDDFGRLPSFLDSFFCSRVICQNGFSPKAVQPEASGVQKKSKDPSGGPRIIW